MEKFLPFFGKEQISSVKPECKLGHLKNIWEAYASYLSAKLLKTAVLIAAFVLGTSALGYAQLYDLSLALSVNKDSVGIGDTVVFTLTVDHESGDTAKNIVVTDSVSSALTVLNFSTPTNGGTTNYDPGTNLITWNLADLDASDGSTSFTFEAIVNGEGIYFNIAEITTAPNDIDSSPDNLSYLEDDIASVCISVPIKFCTAIQDTVLAEAPTGATNVEWYRIYDFGGDGSIGAGDTVAWSTGNSTIIDSIGNYFFTADLGSCQAGNCCPLMVEPACMDLALTKTLATTGSILPGDTVAFDIKIYNQGDIYTDSIQLYDYLPDDLNLVVENGWSLTGTGDTTATKILSVAGGELTSGGLEPLDSVTVSLRAVVNAGFMDTVLVNYAEISSQMDVFGRFVKDMDSSEDNDRTNDNGGIPDSNTDNVTDNSNGDEDDHDPARVRVTQIFDLALTKILVSEGPFTPGDTATFRIYIYNQGTLDATSVSVQDIIPSDLVLADTSWSGSSYTFPDTLLVGAVDSVDIDLQISLNFQDTLITNNAEISAATNALGQEDIDSEPNSEDGVVPDSLDNDVLAIDGSDDYDPAVLLVGQVFDLALTKELVGSSSYSPGDTATFRIYVYNQGSVAATSVTVKDIIPSDLILADPDWNGSDSTYTFTVSHR